MLWRPLHEGPEQLCPTSGRLQRGLLLLIPGSEFPGIVALLGTLTLQFVPQTPGLATWTGSVPLPGVFWQLLSKHNVDLIASPLICQLEPSDFLLKVGHPVLQPQVDHLLVANALLMVLDMLTNVL